MAAFGEPTTTGAGPYLHTYHSGSDELPSMSVEVQMPSVPSFQMFSGVMLNELSFTMARSGLLTATARLMGQGSERVASSDAGTLTAPYAIQRFGNFHGTIERNGAPLGSIVSADVTYSNGLDPGATIKIDGLDLGMASLRGGITARFTDLTLIDQATSGAACSLVFGHEIDEDTNWVLTAHAVYLPLPRTPFTGPNGVEVTFDWQVVRAAASARMATAVLTNSVATY